jgi:hypothetical protein
MTGLTFLGELELVQDQLQDSGFAAFDELPQVDFIRMVAAEFAGVIELMPYQKDGEEMKLLVSVYLQPRGNPGKVIAVLIRDRYPRDPLELQQLVVNATNRLASLGAIAGRFEPESVQSAREQLNRLHSRIMCDWPKVI